MDEYGLGPNGAMLYVAEYLEANLDWLIEKLDQLLDAPPTSSSAHEGGMQEAEKEEESAGYLIFDTPGQVELWTNHDSFKRVIERLTKLDYRVSCLVLSEYELIVLVSSLLSTSPMHTTSPTQASSSLSPCSLFEP